MPKCKSCGREVIFATSENGKTQILDAVSPVYELQHETMAVRSRLHFVTCQRTLQEGKGREGHLIASIFASILVNLCITCSSTLVKRSRNISNSCRVTLI
jgi:hypothetical protein